MSCAGKGFALTLEALLSIFLATALVVPFLSLTQGALARKHAFLHDSQLLDDAVEAAHGLGVFEDLAAGRGEDAEAKLGKISDRLGACLRVSTGAWSRAFRCGGSSTRKITTTRLLARNGTGSGYETISFVLER